MVTCTRCGFEQPKDLYCAKCGVRLPVEVNSADRLPSRSAVRWWGPIALLVVALVGLWFLLLHDRGAPAIDTFSEEPPPASAPATSGPTNPEAPPRTSLLKGAAGVAPIPRPPINAAPTVVSTPQITPTPLVATHGPHPVQFQFVLLARALFDRLSPDLQSRWQAGVPGWLAVTDAMGKVRQLQGDSGFQLLATETRNLTNDRHEMIFNGTNDPKTGQTVGIYVEIYDLGSREGHSNYRLNFQQVLPDATANTADHLSHQFFVQDLSLDKNEGAAFFGLLPHRPIAPNEVSLFNTSSLKAMLDPRFQQGQADLVILFVP